MEPTTKLVVQDFFPRVPSSDCMFMLEAMTYKVMLEASHREASDLVVEAWTNQFDGYNWEGEWHAIPLKYMSTHNGIMTFGESVIVTSDKDFEFTFRLKFKTDKDFTWPCSYGQNGRVKVEPAREWDSWTKGPNFDHILNSVFCGNFIAATNAKQCGFTHVLNVANNLDVVYAKGEKVIYKKVPMTDGAHNPIPDTLIKQAVSWLMEQDDPQHKILVNCRAGIGRAGSVVVAYVFAMKPAWSFEQCKDYVSEQRFVYPHKGLKDILYRLYPRV